MDALKDHDHRPADGKHAHGHSHSHSHAHGHSHGAGASTGRIGAALAITTLILIGEVITAQITGSLALLADAGHMATDSIGLVVALVAAKLSTRPATDSSTWGLRRAEVIGAALQAATLTLVGLSVALNAVRALVSPTLVHGEGMLAMGVIGLVANVISLLILAGGRGENLNTRAAFLEVTGDALGSVAVIGAAVVTVWTGWMHADAVASLLIVALIAPRVAVLLRDTGRMLMDLTPQGLDLGEVREHITSLEGVSEVHDLHAWSVASGLPVLTAHVVVTDQALTRERYGQVLDALQRCVADHFPVRIEHATFQLEPASHREHEPTPCT